MWVFLPGGFVSIVAHRTIPDGLLVRARRREDLEVFRGAGLDAYRCAITATPDADYPFRMLMDKISVSKTLARLVASIDYDNFKAAPGNADRQHMLHDVWREVKQLERG